MILPEIIAVGIYDSRIVNKNIRISKNRKTSMFEIELPFESGGVSYVGSNSMPINPDMIICAKPGQVRHTKFPFKCFYVHMILEGGILYDTLMNMPDFFETDKAEFYKEIFSKLVRYHNTPSKNDEIILQSLILELIYAISGDAERNVKTRNTKNLKNNNHLMIEKVCRHIKNNLTGDLSLEKISQTAHLSPVHFHNSFKAAVGMTLRDYVEQERLKKAANLLITTNHSLTQIAFECGFSSQSYFSYVFKRRMKKTPREYAHEIYGKYEI